VSEAGYVDAGGLRTYWEAHGSGEPVLLLHGGFEHAGALPRLTEALAARYRVIEPERRAHGRTADPGGELHYEAMADDTLAFMNALGLARPRVVGFSDGAIVALLLALRRPDRVGRLVLVGANYDASGLRPGFLRLVTETPFEHLFPELVAAHRRLSPDGPEHYRAVVERVRRLWAEEPHLDPAALARIASPALVLAGDGDAVVVEHTVALFRALRDARLCIVPGGSHGVLTEHPDLCASVILEFLVG
jgi:pimeloyl-ACP methyl ester carboxylesterase